MHANVTLPLKSRKANQVPNPQCCPQNDPPQKDPPFLYIFFIHVLGLVRMYERANFTRNFIVKYTNSCLQKDKMNISRRSTSVGLELTWVLWQWIVHCKIRWITSILWNMRIHQKAPPQTCISERCKYNEHKAINQDQIAKLHPKFSSDD